MGETEEPTLRHVLHRVCKLHTIPKLEEYLKMIGLSDPEGFAIAEQEDFHNLVQDIGTVAVRKLMILSNYCKVHDSFPPMDIPISQVQKALKESGDLEEFIPIPPSPVQSSEGSLCSSEESQSRFPLKRNIGSERSRGYHSKTKRVLW